MNALTKFLLLLWKNYKLKLRNPLTTVLELFIPCVFTLLLVIVRTVIKFDTYNEPTVYKPFSIENVIDSSGSSVVILFTPNTTLFENVMDNFVKTVNNLPTSNQNYTSKRVEKRRTRSHLYIFCTGFSFGTEQEMVDFYVKNNTNIIIGGVVFRSVVADNIDFKLRLKFVPKSSNKFDFNYMTQFTWETNRQFPLFQEPGPRAKKLSQGGMPDYMGMEFLFLQHHISKSIARTLKPDKSSWLSQTTVSIQRFPYPPYIDDKFLYSLQFLLPLILMMSFIYPSVNLVKNIVLEKEQRLKEAMRIMGLEDWLNWASWFANSLAMILFSIGVMTTLFCVKFPFKDYMPILINSDPSLILLFFVFYTISSISFCFMMSTFFDKANIAGVVSGAVYFSTFIPYFYLNENYKLVSKRIVDVN